jgi:hypothetical protein
MGNSKKYKAWTHYFFSIVAIIFFSYFFYEHFPSFPHFELSSQNLLIVTICICLSILSTFLSGLIWHLFLLDYHGKVFFSDTQTIFLISQLGKYFPGNFGHFLGRFVFAKKIEIPHNITLTTLALEIISMVVTSLLIILMSFLFFDTHLPGLLSYISFQDFLILGSLLIISPWLFITILNKFFFKWLNRLFGIKRIRFPRFSTLLKAIFLFSCWFFLFGLITKLLTLFLFNINVQWVQVTGLYSLAWLSGYLSPGAPAGLGVRELMIILLFSPLIGIGPATAIGGILRVITTLADLFSFGIGLSLKKFLFRSIK